MHKSNKTAFTNITLTDVSKLKRVTMTKRNKRNSVHLNENNEIQQATAFDLFQSGENLTTTY